MTGIGRVVSNDGPPTVEQQLVLDGARFVNATWPARFRKEIRALLEVSPDEALFVLAFVGQFEAVPA